jgi:hypothetical protein
MMIDKSEELYLKNTTITRNIRGDVDSTEYKSRLEFTVETAWGRRKVAFRLYCLIFSTLCGEAVTLLPIRPGNTPQQLHNFLQIERKRNINITLCSYKMYNKYTVFLHTHIVMYIYCIVF